MSLAIHIATESGIVAAADSRQTYRNRKQHSRIGSDTAEKIFQFGPSAVISLVGIAFLNEDGGPRSIGSLVQDFLRSNEEKLGKRGPLEKHAADLHAFLASKYDVEARIKELKAGIEKELNEKGLKRVGDFVDDAGRVTFDFVAPDGKQGKGVAVPDRIEFLLSGYDTDGMKTIRGVLPGDVTVVRKKGLNDYGANWVGQTDLVVRMLIGRDDRLLQLPVLQPALSGPDAEGVLQQLRALEYSISWATMTPQDAVDFCVLAIQTTSAVQRFSDGIQSDPGDVPGVGGPVDVAVVQPGGEFSWVQRKALAVKGKQ